MLKKRQFKLTTQFGFDAHGCSARTAESSDILCKDSEFILCSFHQPAHGELSIFGTLFVAFLPGTVSSLPELNPVAKNLFATILLRSEPVDCDAVFSDRNDVDLSWLAGFI